MRVKTMALCAMVIGICSTAQAQSSSTVSFSLTAPVALNTGIDSIDAGRATVGSWIDSYRPNQSHWQNAYSTSIYLSGGISYLGGPGPGHIADPANESYHYTRPTGDGFNSEFLGVKPGGDFGIPPHRPALRFEYGHERRDARLVVTRV